MSAFRRTVITVVSPSGGRYYEYQCQFTRATMMTRAKSMRLAGVLLLCSAAALTPPGRPNC